MKVSESKQTLEELQLHIAALGQLDVQLAQTPLAPHSLSDVPGKHVPPEAAEQQPPLHAWVVEHAEVHEPVDVSQASLAGQSVVMLQPHAPVDRHAAPLAPPEQETHASPVAPHAFLDVPGAHMPVLALQQPPLHG